MNQNVDKHQNFIKWLKETPTYTTTRSQLTNSTQATTSRTRYVKGNVKQEEHFRKAATTFLQQETLNKISTNIKKVSGKPKSDNCNRPTNITTQIAKISYKSDKSKIISDSKERFTIIDSHRNNDDQISHITHNSRSTLNSDKKIMNLGDNTNLLEDFAKKKKERDQEISEIQEMLNKIKSPIETTSHSMMEIEKEESEHIRVERQATGDVKDTNSKEMTKMSTIGRSKTELQMNSKSKIQEEPIKIRTSRKDTARSSTSQIDKPRSKSSQLPTTQKDSEPVKKIGYNPVDARRFMENQKKLRKSNIANNQAENIKMEKEKIKQRLEELRKNSRKLVSKNLQKKLNAMTNKHTFMDPCENIELKPKETVILTKPKDYQEIREDLKGLSLDLPKPFSTNSKTDRPQTTKKKMSEITSRSTHSLSTILAPKTYPLLENHKRIGLLRKSENEKDFSIVSHRTINLDKENLALEELTSKLNTPLEVRHKDMRKEMREKQIESPKLQENENILNEELHKPKESSMSVAISDLEIPQNNLKPNENKEPLQQKTFRKDDIAEKSSKPNDLPYWLRPSAAQVYPYNFIVAVRRKLESIAQPRLQESSNKNHQCTSTTDLDIDLQYRQTKRKSLEEYPEEQKVKKIKNQDEPDAKSSQEDTFIKQQKQINVNSEAKNCGQKRSENSYQEVVKIKQLKPLPKSLTSDQLEEPNPKYSTEPVSQFQYLKKSIQSKDLVDVKPINWQQNKTKKFMDIPTIPPYKPLKKSIQRPASDQEDLKEINTQFKLPKDYKSMESVNSEIHSNLSSISIQNPISNTLTEVSSLRTESRRTFNQPNKTQNFSEDEVTSISSHIFSSPEKKYQDFEFTKPRPVSPLSLEKVDKLKIQRKDPGSLKRDSDNEDMNFSQLLEDFNRSLSQVIQVNEQLKCTLDKSQQILSPRTSKKSSEHYSSDFENSTQPTQHSMESEKLKENLQNNNENLKQRKRQLFEVMAEKVKPLLTPQKSLKDSEELLQKDKQKSMPEINMEINLKSLNNSSNISQESTTNTSANQDDNQTVETPQIYEERLQQIEQLKINLKQTLLESQKERQESERLKANELKSQKYIIKERKGLEISSANEQVTKNFMSTKSNTVSSQIISQQKRNGIETLQQTFSRKDNSSKDFKENEDKLQSQKENARFSLKTHVKNSGIETLYENEEFCKKALTKMVLNENKNAAKYIKEHFKENPTNYKDKHSRKLAVERNGNETNSTFHSEKASDSESFVPTNKNIKNSYEERYGSGNETHSTFHSSKASYSKSFVPSNKNINNSYEERYGNSIETHSSKASDSKSFVPSNKNVNISYEERYGNETYLNKTALDTHNRTNSVRNSSETLYLDSNSSRSPSKSHKRHQNYQDSKILTDNSAKNSNNYSTLKSCSTNPTHSIMETPKSPQKHTNSQTSKLTKSESGTNNQSDIESITQKEEKSQPALNQVDALSSSIAEELQNTFESASQDNENIPMPPNSISSKSTTKIHSKSNDSSAFIKSHINRSRGDFQQIVSNEAKLNETKFQQAISFGQLSSTEFAQSADDEVTSSEASKTKVQTTSNPPSYNAIASAKHHKQPSIMSSPSKSARRMSIGSEIVKFFNQYDTERSQSQSKFNDTMSESSLNYSNIGLYDKLIQNETSKSQHLTILLKMREKALLDRTKGQIAWLEVQKARYKAKGLLSHIAAIKKKQRCILLKMEKEREDIKRLLQSTTNQTAAVQPTQTSSGGPKTISHHNTPTKHKREKLTSSASALLQPPLGKVKSINPQTIKSEQTLGGPILRATYELESSHALEELLIKREDDLRRRREHVERLMQWHQRLDEEEAEVLNLERQILDYNNVPHVVEQQQKTKLQNTAETKEKLTQAIERAEPTKSQDDQPEPTIKTPEKKRASRARKMEKRLKEIDKSLRELSHISTTSTNTSGPVMGQSTNNDPAIDSVSSTGTHEVDFVRTTGSKLNKLWKRLTSQQLEKYEPNRRFKLCKSDLERLYEEAKMAVLRDFAEDEDRIAQELLEKSSTNFSATASPIAPAVHLQDNIDANEVEIPVLNLNFSSGPSEPEEESANNSKANPNVVQQGNYSPSVAEENFKAAHLLNSSASSSETSEQQSTSSDPKQQTRLENNVQMFLALTQRITSARRVAGLQRSLSDTEIADKPKFSGDTTTTSQKNIATATSQSNSSITTNQSSAGTITTTQHQRSKSSIVELTTNIPSTQTPIDHRKKVEDELTHTKKQLKDLENELSDHSPSRSSVIKSIGRVTPLKSGTSSDIPTLTEDPQTSHPTTECITKDSFKHKSTFSGQVSSDCETKAKEISSKLEEISHAISQLSKSNGLPSYSSVAHTKTKSLEVQLPVATNDDSNLSTDASSYSFNFENISTDRHSSPGASEPNLHTNSILNRTITSIKYTKDTEENKTASPELIAKDSLATDEHTSASTSTSHNTTNSKTFVKDCAKSLSSKTLTQSLLENRILDTYEADFEPDLSNETHIEDITIPTFEITGETTQDEDEENNDAPKSSSTSTESQEVVENLSTEASDKTYCADAAKDSSDQIVEQTISLPKPSTSLDRELLPAPPSIPPPPPPPPSSSSTSSIQNSNQLMPDIINELELRRHQLILENEHLKQYEHVTAVPYMYVREIPNKPPPPYVPPAHGSPMTTIFPSEERIKDITYRRTHELYCELLKTEYCNEIGEKLPSVMEEQITNIYERIILDICREYLEERGEILRDGDPSNFHSQLAFFNPPNRLRCIQDAIYKEVRSCLAMDKTQPKRTQIYSVYGQRAKQDHIGKIIIQEMYDEDDRWCNFHLEESEVLHLMVEEMLNKNIVEIAKEVLIEEGGTIDAEEEDVEELETEEDVVDKENQTQLLSSVFVETINEDETAHCLNKSDQDYSLLKTPEKYLQNTTLASSSSSPDHNDSMNTVNAVQTCT